MSRASDCAGCMFGNHDKHDRDWNITPGLIGGEYCDCQGDCDVRSAAAAEEMLRIWMPELFTNPEERP